MSQNAAVEATLVCDACAAEWTAAGHLDALDEDENEFWPSPLFFAHEKDVCPDCGCEDWGYESVTEGGR